MGKDEYVIGRDSDRHNVATIGNVLIPAFDGDSDRVVVTNTNRVGSGTVGGEGHGGGVAVAEVISQDVGRMKPEVERGIQLLDAKLEGFQDVLQRGIQRLQWTQQVQLRLKKEDVAGLVEDVQHRDREKDRGREQLREGRVPCKVQEGDGPLEREVLVADLPQSVGSQRSHHQSQIERVGRRSHAQVGLWGVAAASRDGGDGLAIG